MVESIYFRKIEIHIVIMIGSDLELHMNTISVYSRSCVTPGRYCIFSFD